MSKLNNLYKSCNIHKNGYKPVSVNENIATSPDEPTEHDQAIADTLAFWQERTGVDLAIDDAREIFLNVSGFFRLLALWDKRRLTEKAMHKTNINEGEK